MRQRLLRISAALAFVAMAGTLAYAQGGSTSAPLSGVVVDPQGAAVPGANVVVKNEGTGVTYQAVTSAQGAFTVPALQAGTYSVTVSLAGFKQIVLKGIILSAATPASVNATLQVGGMEETITVDSAGSLVQTQSSAVMTTIDVNQMNNLPVQSRNALDALTFLPGVSTPDTNRNSTVSGLNKVAINVTMDGLSLQDNFLKTTDGYFARLRPSLDAVEEVTMTTAAQGADSSGQGAVQIRFITRTGTNEFHGSVYEYYQSDKLNSNTWFANRDGAGKTVRTNHQPGFRIGGPIRIPGLFDGRNKAFFFLNYEENRTPGANTLRNRNILKPPAQRGIFSYTVGGQTREVNLLQLAAANGHASTTDPTIAKLLADIRASTTTTGNVLDALGDPNMERFSYQSPFNSITRYPTARLDFDLTQKHRLSVTYTMNKLLSDPDTLNDRDRNFPGFPVAGVQDSKRFGWAGTLRSTLSSNLVNELRVFGATGGATLFSTEINPSMWSGSVANQGGYQLNINGTCCATSLPNTTSTANQAQNITNASSGPGLSSREASTRIAYDNLTWIKGSHNLTFGAEFTQARVWLWNQSQVPTINFGIVTGDPAQAMFNATNFPGASAANLNAAQGLYSLLVGRVSGIVGNIRLEEDSNQYKYLGASRQRGRFNEYGFFVQDNWRFRPNLTLNVGLRYELQLPFTPQNDLYSTSTMADVFGVSGSGNLFKPGTLGGKSPQFIQYKKGQKAYNTDWNNIAPSLGFAWRPHLESGFLAKILGNEPVVRAGFAIAYNRVGMTDFTTVFGNNPGILVDANRSQNTGNLGALPVLLRERERLGPPTFLASPVYPSGPPNTDASINIFDPNIQVPYSQSWQFGVQREIGRKMFLSVGYVGTRGLQEWLTGGVADRNARLNYNEINIYENGFLNEFRVAQRNLEANIAAGRGATFAFTGAAGTAPLPIFLAYFSGIPASQAGDPSRYNSTNFTNSTFVNPLARFNPTPQVAADNLDADATRRANALAAGLPANFLVANPDVLGGAFVTGNGGNTGYHSLQVELNRRMSHGLQFASNYVLGKTYESARYSLRTPQAKRINGGTVGGVTHAFKLASIWELPFGKGKRFAGGASGALDRIIGGWSLAGTGRIQSGRLLDFGNVRLVGMSKQDVTKMVKLRFDDAGKKIYMLPQDVIDNTVKAFSTSATSPTGYGALGAPSGRYFAPANGPDCIERTYDTTPTNSEQTGFGDCGVGSLVVTGPKYWTTDLSIVKRIPLKRNLTLDLRAEMLNAFNHANFTPNFGPGVTAAGIGSNDSSYLVTTADSGRTVQFVGRISW